MRNATKHNDYLNHQKRRTRGTLKIYFQKRSATSATSFLIQEKRSAFPQLRNEIFIPSQSTTKVLQLNVKQTK